jgi:hypothetical protein
MKRDMKRGWTPGLMLIVTAICAGVASAQDTAGPATGRTAEPAQGFIVAIPAGSNATAASQFAQEQPNAADEPQRLPPTEVRAYRTERAPCDHPQGQGPDACRAQLAAKYAEMDKLCRIASGGSELPVCIQSAYAAVG